MIYVWWKVNSLSCAPIITKLADWEAEIVTLQSNFDELIASSKMIEGVLEAELTNALLSYIDRTGSHQVWISGICSPKPTFWVVFPKHILKGAICAAKSKYEDEWTICRAAEVAQDKAESRACQTEESLKALRHECNAIHKSLAFREAEREELKIELDI